MPVTSERGTASFTAEQIRNAQIIISVGRGLGASNRDIQIALATALQESSLLNVAYGTGSSLGLFQQTGPWGTRAQRLDPREATRMFFLGGHGAGQPGLLDNHWREHQTLTEAAQWVQRSAYPNAYAKWAGAAAALARKYGDGVASPTHAHPVPGMPGPPTGTPQTPAVTPAVPTEEAKPAVAESIATPQFPGIETQIPEEMYTDWEPGQFDLPALPSDQVAEVLSGINVGGGKGSSLRQAIVSAAMGYLGQPYEWGALDCSGLVQRAFAANGIELPRVSYAQANTGKRVPISALKPGDLVAWDNSSRNNGADHIAVYAGGGYIIEAPRTGLNVRRRKLGSDEGSMWGVSLSSLLGG